MSYPNVRLAVLLLFEQKEGGGGEGRCELQWLGQHGATRAFYAAGWGANRRMEKAQRISMCAVNSIQEYRPSRWSQVGVCDCIHIYVDVNGSKQARNTVGRSTCVLRDCVWSCVPHAPSHLAPVLPLFRRVHAGFHELVKFRLFYSPVAVAMP